MMIAVRASVFLALVACATSQQPFELFPFPSGESINTIVNGESAGAEEFPWYAVFAGGTLCGGALIADNVVVTAAHCLGGGAPGQLRVGATTAGGGVLVDVCDSIIHPNYRDRELENDIAVLTLCDPVSNQVAQINTDAATPGNNDNLIVMGFGRTNPDSGGGSNVLLKLDMEYVDDAECSDRFGDHNPGFNLCVDNPSGGICFGDSGSPVVDNTGIVMGVASFIIQACDSDFPDFYTRMSSYSTWVERQVCEQSDNPPDTIDCTGIGDDDGPDGGDEDCFLLDLLDTILDLFG